MCSEAACSACERPEDETMAYVSKGSSRASDTPVPRHERTPLHPTFGLNKVNSGTRVGTMYKDTYKDTHEDTYDDDQGSGFRPRPGDGYNGYNSVKTLPLLGDTNGPLHEGLTQRGFASPTTYM